MPRIDRQRLAGERVRRIGVEEVFANKPQYRFVEQGTVDGEPLYAASGRTDAGRYVIVFFIFKLGGCALIISARDMDRKERRLYGR